MYNWTVNFFENRAYCTKFAGVVSAIAVIHASVIQGSALGPASYIVTESDLHPVHDSRAKPHFTFADGTYLIMQGPGGEFGDV